MSRRKKPAEQPSLLQASESQPSLLPASTDPFSAMENAGDFTGERLFQQRPDTYKSVVVLLGQRVGVIRIGRLLGVSPGTVMAVRDREGATIGIVQDHLARVSHAGATVASEGLLEQLSDILSRGTKLEMKALKDLAVIYGILNQNAQLLAGMPTARVEVTDGARPEHDDFNAYLASLRNAAPDTHLSGEKSGVKEGAVVGPMASVVAVDVVPAPGPVGTDGERKD